MFTSYGNSGRWQGDEVYTPGLIGLAGECTPLGFHQLMVDELHQALTTSSDPDFSVSLWLHTNEANLFDKVFLFYQEDGALSHSTVSTQAEGTEAQSTEAEGAAEGKEEVQGEGGASRFDHFSSGGQPIY